MEDMDDFKYRNKRVRFWKYQGEVLDVDRYSDTSVTARGGVNSRVQVSQDRYHEFWIRQPDGEEKHLRFGDADVPMRAGHEVTVLCAGRPGAGEGWVCSVLNHSTQQAHDTLSAKALLQRLRLVRITGVSLLLALAAAAIVVFLTMPPSGYFAHPWKMARWDWALIAGIVVLVLRIWRKGCRSRRITRALKQHILEMISLASAYPTTRWPEGPVSR